MQCAILLLCLVEQVLQLLLTLLAELLLLLQSFAFLSLLRECSICSVELILVSGPRFAFILARVLLALQLLKL